MTMRVVLVDDEPLARTRMRRLLADRGGIEIVGEAGDGISACALIADQKPDLVLLDVQMPGLSGFDVLARLGARPDVIFVTAHDEFAVRAFEEQAIDYLLKPVEPARLARAIARAAARRDAQPVAPAHAPAASPVADDRFDRLLEALARARPSVQRIAVRRGAKVSLVEPAAIVFCRAEDKYTVLYTADGEHVVDRTIDELERTLDPAAFLRIHRSAIVNLAFVKDLTAVEGGRFLVSLSSPAGATLHASRTGAKMLREKFGF
jgi:two-component system, LytTR family, response regulator